VILASRQCNKQESLQKALQQYQLVLPLPLLLNSGRHRCRHVLQSKLQLLAQEKQQM
jgi:hypothetical protein